MSRAQKQDNDDDEQYVNENGFIQLDFADMKQENKKIITLGKYDPNQAHMVVSSGLNFEGVCQNKGCKVANKVVWIQKGFGIFDISQSIDDLKCPICHKNLSYKTVKSLGYLKARVKCSGKRVGEAKKIEWQDQQVDGKLVKYEGYDGKNCDWHYLRLSVQKI